MSCDQIQDSLIAYVLGELPMGETLRVEQHMNSGCTSCNEELIQVSRQLDQVYQAVPTETLSDVEIDQRKTDCVKFSLQHANE